MAYQMRLDYLNDKADSIRWTQHMYHEEQLRLEKIVNDLNADENDKNKAVERIGKLDKKIGKLEKKLCRILQKIIITSRMHEDEFNYYMAQMEDGGYDNHYEIVGDED